MPVMSTRITVSLPEREYAALSALARQYDVSLSWLTRKAVADFLKHHDEGKDNTSGNLPLTQREECK